MPPTCSTHGTIWALFGHRLAIESPEGRVLVDLGPEGARALALAGVTLTPGDAIAVTGERKPSEIKAIAITAPDGMRHAIARPRPEDGDAGQADPTVAFAALRKAGFQVEGEARRRPKHFEIRARKDGGYVEAHVTFVGVIRKTKALSGTAAPTG
ncbi:hypothetical protein ASF41_21395 [Methylobacterium sp. Leaf111]|uniref:hypothetical protein n=1 Tax=Methylobacterium sp. Leaf111 TaxID=1736257 RepID=UPI0006F386FF|nr:hypothetical protein [Methylobacterium sp. Leaf111]KQP67774.1 hypothetical protein ASF41_21395 [Methylobacterium sp. Leaf111]